MLSRRFVDQLKDAVGPDHVLEDPDVTSGYARDWTGRFVGATPAVVRPGSTSEVAAVIALCRGDGVAIVPQGGNTGLVGGGVPSSGEVVLSLRRLDQAPLVDTAAGHATVGAGASLEALQRAAAAAGMAYGVDLASRASATLGGTIATNAGGLRVLRYGDTRAQLLGVEAVLGDGSVISHLEGLTRDNSGYHLPSVLAGSEGTLAIITHATVRLVPAAGGRGVALIGFASAKAAVTAAAAARTTAEVQAVELMLEAGIDLVARTRHRRPPLQALHPAYLLLEVAGEPVMERLAEIVAGLPGALDAALADDPRGRAALWAWRESHTECINSLGPPVKMDVTLPLRALADFIESVPATVQAAHGGASTWLFGHVADGNIHVNVTGTPGFDDQIQDAVFRRVAEASGSISTEHGIGTAKRRWLHLVRSAAEIEALRRIKAALDPDLILNPNVLLPDG